MKDHKLKSKCRHAEERIKQSDARCHLFCVQCSMNKDPRTSITYNPQHRVTFPFLEVHELLSPLPCSNLFVVSISLKNCCHLYLEYLWFWFMCWSGQIWRSVWRLAADTSHSVEHSALAGRVEGCFISHIRVKRNVCHNVTEIRCGDVDSHSENWHSLKPQISSLIITLLKNDAREFHYIPLYPSWQ